MEANSVQWEITEYVNVVISTFREEKLYVRYCFSKEDNWWNVTLYRSGYNLTFGQNKEPLLINPYNDSIEVKEINKMFGTYSDDFKQIIDGSISLMENRESIKYVVEKIIRNFSRK